jgi:hypothetical protein
MLGMFGCSDEPTAPSGSETAPVPTTAVEVFPNEPFPVAPPSLTAVGASGTAAATPFTREWITDGRRDEQEPESPPWPEAVNIDGLDELRFATSVLPTLVEFRVFGDDVDDTGVPVDPPVAETRCGSTAGGEPAEHPCTVMKAGDVVSVTGLPSLASGAQHVVVFATWYVPSQSLEGTDIDGDMPEVSASWVLTLNG